MRSLAVGIAVLWPTCGVAVAADIDAPRLDTARKVAPALPSPQIAPTSPTPVSTITNPNLRRVTPVLQTDAGGWDFGCALDHFEPHERVASQTRFAMPIPASDIWGLLPEPGVTHADRDGVRDGDYFRCTPFASNHLCYDGHEGTDFTLAGAFLQMGTVRAAAAASGVVMRAVDRHFDGCHANPDPRAYLDSDRDNNVICPDPDHPESVALTDPNLVQVCHPDGTITRYLHLMKDSIPAGVTADSRVACGQTLGLVGSSGRSAAPHLHFDVLIPATRWDGSPARTKPIDGRTYVYVDPFGATASASLWTQPAWNYGFSQSGAGLVPAIAHPNGHPTTLACPHLAPPHASDPGPALPCTHPVHASGDPIMTPCTHPAHDWHGLVPCTHPQHPDGHALYIAGKKQYGPCLHVQHPAGHPTQVPCLHPPVPQHPSGHAGPTLPCLHVVLQSSTAANAFTLPGPQCDL